MDQSRIFILFFICNFFLHITENKKRQEDPTMSQLFATVLIALVGMSTLLIFLVLFSSSKLKTDYERELEDREQTEYMRIFKNKAAK